MTTAEKDKIIKSMAKLSGWKKASETKEKCPYCGLPEWELTGSKGKRVMICEDLFLKGRNRRY
jgi:hypothetical protein